MRTPEFIQRCMDAGMPLAMALTAAKVFEAECEIAVAEVLEARRAKERARQAKHRAKDNGSHVMSRDKTLEPVEQRDLTGEPTQVVTPSLPSLRSEELTSEAKASSVNASKPADPEKPKTKPPKSERGTRLASDWEPSAEEFDMGREAGLTDEEIQHAALEFRNYWCARSRDAAKLSWRLTWHNRVLDIGKRKRERGPRLVASSTNAGGGRRGASSFADIYARRHGYVEN